MFTEGSLLLGTVWRTSLSALTLTVIITCILQIRNLITRGRSCTQGFLLVNGWNQSTCDLPRPPCSHPSYCTTSMDDRHGAMWTLGEQGKTQTPAASGITTAPAHFLVLTSQHPIFKWLYFIFSKMQNFYFKISELGSILNLMDEKHHCVISSAGNFFLSWWDIFYNHWHLRFDEIWYL